MHCEADFNRDICLEYLERLKMKRIASFWNFCDLFNEYICEQFFFIKGQGERQAQCER